MEASADCTVAVDNVAIDWYWIPDSSTTGDPEPMPANSGNKSSFEHVGAPDTFEFEVNWQGPHNQCQTAQPVYLIMIAYDADDNVLWSDSILLRTVRHEATLESVVDILDYCYVKPTL